ncbi:MAG TPA: hypothetical protein VH575_17550 [Gemmataceae bacterium]
MPLFVAAAVSVPLAQSFRREHLRQTAPQNLIKFAERIKANRPELHVVPMLKNGAADSGFWVCTHPRSWDELSGLAPLPQFEAEWAGIVAIVRKQDYFDVNVGWQDLSHGFAFGDPDLIVALSSR